MIILIPKLIQQLFCEIFSILSAPTTYTMSNIPPSCIGTSQNRLCKLPRDLSLPQDPVLRNIFWSSLWMTLSLCSGSELQKQSAVIVLEIFLLPVSTVRLTAASCPMNFISRASSSVLAITKWKHLFWEVNNRNEPFLVDILHFFKPFLQYLADIFSFFNEVWSVFIVFIPCLEIKRRKDRRTTVFRTCVSRMHCLECGTRS